MSDNYPEYDPAMELLALLPRSPTSASMDSLLQDLGLLAQADLKKLFDALEAKGIGIRRWTEGGHRVAAIAHGDWATAKRLATEYVNARDAVNT